MREVLRTQSEEAPNLKIHRFHREFMHQIEVFIAQLGEVTFVKGIFLIVFRDSLQFEKSSLSHEDRLYLEKVVTMVGYGRKRQTACPQLESIVIDTKPIVACEGHEVGVLPRPIAKLYPLSDSLRLLFESLGLERSHPGMHHQACQIGNHLVTRRITIDTQQFVVMFPDIVGHIELHLFDKLPVTVHDFCVDNACHMEDHVVVVLVFVMSMQIPVARLVMNLDISNPESPADSHFRIEEVWTCVAIVQSRVNHLDVLSVARFHSLQREHLVLPHIMQ